MSPETIEGRLRALERTLAVTNERIRDLTEELESVKPLEPRLLRLSITVDQIKREVDQIIGSLRDRDRSATEERRAVKVALIALTATILAALIGGGFALLIALTGGKP